MPSPAEFGVVEGSAAKVLIVGTGPSADQFNFDAVPSDVHIIAVKDAALRLRRFDTWVTVDPNAKCNVVLGERKQGARYYAAIPEDFGTPEAAKIPHRRVPWADVTYLKRSPVKGVDPVDWRLSEDPSTLTAGNSAFSALNIAYLMGARRVVLVGVDATHAGYGLSLPGRPRGNMDHVPKLFEAACSQLAARNVQVRIAGSGSRITCFTRASPREALAWLAEPMRGLVLGSALCWQDDVNAALDMSEFDYTFAAKDAGVVWPGHLDAWVTLHPKTMRSMVNKRAANGYLPAREVIAHARPVKEDVEVFTSFEDYLMPGQRSSGSSGAFAVKIALLRGCDRVVLCGVPLLRSAGKIGVGPVWAGTPTFQSGFRQASGYIDGRVRSMSGWTRNFFGYPTQAWLAGGK